MNCKLTQGSEFWLEGKLMIFKRRWHSVIKSIKPYQYLDEMLTGPLKRWRHLHKFSDININNNQKQTEVIDEVDFELPYSPLGKLFEDYASRRLEKFFNYKSSVVVYVVIPYKNLDQVVNKIRHRCRHFT
jgi:ligand-binding SRPBCC domain-containing protein